MQFDSGLAFATPLTVFITGDEVETLSGISVYLADTMGALTEPEQVYIDLFPTIGAGMGASCDFNTLLARFYAPSSIAVDAS